MNDTTTGRTTVEPTELIDMRTHLTVAMLASSQLDRKTRHVPDAPHLQGYLDQSLQSLVKDVERVDALVARVTEQQKFSTYPVTVSPDSVSFGSGSFEPCFFLPINRNPHFV